MVEDFLIRTRVEITELREKVKRLEAVLADSLGNNGQAVVRTCIECQQEFTRFACQSHMKCDRCQNRQDRADARRWRWVREHGPRCLLLHRGVVKWVADEAADARADQSIAASQGREVSGGG